MWFCPIEASWVVSIGLSYNTRTKSTSFSSVNTTSSAGSNGSIYHRQNTNSCGLCRVIKCKQNFLVELIQHHAQVLGKYWAWHSISIFNKCNHCSLGSEDNFYPVSPKAQDQKYIMSKFSYICVVLIEMLGLIAPPC